MRRHTGDIRHLMALLVAIASLVAMLSGCAILKSPPSTDVVTLDIFGWPTAENWDADPEADGIEVEIWPKDAEGHMVEAGGTVSAQLWLQKSFFEAEKGELIQTWGGIPVSKEDYGFIGGAVLRLEYRGFTPTGDDWGILEVTLTISDGKSYTAREKDIHLGVGEPETAAFELKKWQVIDDSGVAALQISFSATKDLKLLLTDPAGVQVGFKYAELGVTGACLRMAGYGETPPAGEYTLLVKRYDELVDSIAFDFEGANLEVTDVDTLWEYHEYEFLEDHYSLEEVEISVINHGDLPAYVDEATLKLNGETKKLYFFNGAVLPEQEETFTESIIFMYDIAPGRYELTLKIKDSAGETLASYSGNVKLRP